MTHEEVVGVFQACKDSVTLLVLPASDQEKTAEHLREIVMTSCSVPLLTPCL